MTTLVLHPRAWGTSIAAHAAVVLAFAVFLGAGHHHHHDAPPPPPVRLVWVEPAPPALAAPAPAAPIVEPPAVPAPVVEQAPTKPETAKPPVLKKTGTAKPAPPARPEPAPAPPPRSDVPRVAAPGAAPHASGGVVGGLVSGVPGGLGDAPLALAAVARPPELLERVVPEYPPRARALEVEGQVVLEVVLDRQGRPEDEIRVLRSVPLLDAAAVAAVRRWRFRPARDAEGQAVRVVMEVPVRFVLR